MFKISNARLLLIAAVFAASCSKVEKGFLSPNLYYVENPFSVKQGVTKVSSPLSIDGSTTPVSVSLLEIREKKSGKNVDSVFLSKQTMTVFAAPITYADSTVASLDGKLKDSSIAPFSINPIGGRLQFTANSTYIPQGVYTIDLKVSNIRGEQTLKDICDISIEPTEFFSKGGAEYGYLMDTITAARIYTVPDITAVRQEGGAAKIIIKWVDEDGKLFNPKAGEVLARPGLASFQNWDPYFKQELTDTAFVFQYPDHVPVFPLFNPALVIGTTTQADYWCYYRIPAAFVKEPGMEHRTGFSFYFPNAVGTYIVTIKEQGVHKK